MSRCGHRFYLPTTLEIGRTVELPERIARQLARVLRLRPGDSIVLFDGRGVD
ncbi:MAG: RNA methyltransferase PUA domain-containing protein, partial [Thermomicrobium sp.]